MTALVLSIAYFLAAAAILAMLCRLPLPGTAVHKFIIEAGLTGLALMIHLHFLDGFGSQFWTGILAYAFICELFIFLFTMVGSSISAAILLRLRHGRLSQQGFGTHFDPVKMVDERIGNMISIGLIERLPDGRLAMTDKGLTLHRNFDALRHFFRHPNPTVAVAPITEKHAVTDGT